jgi:quercetin dioxygenase-like cupin family protein
MRTSHVISGAQPPAQLSVLGESVTVFGEGDASKPFEVHIQEGRRGGGPPPHHHPWDEAFYVLEGKVALTLEGATQVLGPGSYVHVPAHTVHAYENVSETAKLLAVVSDCRGGEMFAALDERVRVLPQDLPLVQEVGRDFGVEFLVADEA